MKVKKGDVEHNNMSGIKLYMVKLDFRLLSWATLFIISLWATAAFTQNDESLLTKAGAFAFPTKADNSVILDQPIDPLTYPVGPGDNLRIFVWGDFQQQFDVMVTPEGKVLIPTVGPVDISGMLLSEAKVEIESNVAQRLRNVQVTIDLIGLRNFKVGIGGAVYFPGIYTANAVTRVSEIIAMAGGFVGEDTTRLSPNVNNTKERILPRGPASHRNILIRKTSGIIDTADVLLFEQTGDMHYNFKLADGDEIFVPFRDEKIKLYGIFGGVRNPAYFEYSYRDSLTDLLKLGHGLTLDADSSSAELVRYASNGKTVERQIIDLQGVLRGNTPDIAMCPDDRVYIKTRNDFNVKDQVLILGEVKYPGFYAIEPDSTYLSQVIAEAGGFTDIASLTEAEMTRFTDKNIADREFDRLKQMLVADMSDLEYEYFKVKSREEPGRVAVDFNELFNGNSAADIKLRGGDIIQVPKISQVVKVSGEVANPGLLAYNPEYNYSDYVKLAGGYSFRANEGKVRIIKAMTGEWKKAKKGTELYPGDTILVPEKKKINYLTIFKDVIAVTANVATIYLVIQEATN